MILRSLNKNLEKFGFPEEINYENPKFHGHQKGIAVAVKNNNTDEIEENYLSESLGDEQTRDFLLSQLLSDNQYVLVEDNITQMNKEHTELIPKTIYFLPYYVKDHSVFQPTVNYDNVSGAINVSYELDIEILFVDENLCRYITLHQRTRNIPIMSLIYDMFTDEGPDDEELESMGISYCEEDEENEEGYILDFYSESGESFKLCYEHLEDLRDKIASMRLINIVCIIDKPEKEDNQED